MDWKTISKSLKINTHPFHDEDSSSEEDDDEDNDKGNNSTDDKDDVDDNTNSIPDDSPANDINSGDDVSSTSEDDLMCSRWDQMSTAELIVECKHWAIPANRRYKLPQWGVHTKYTSSWESFTTYI